jgi:ABC-type nitrate/sulfonate/bicarbonate transport system substrate-binding protein
MYVAIDRGFLAAEGLEPVMVYEKAEKDLISGEVDFLLGRLGHIEFLKGMEIRLVCGLATEGGSHVLVARPGIRSAHDLKEVTVAAEQNVMELRAILAHHGVDLDRSNIKTPLIQGSHPKQYEAMKQGTGDGAMLGAPWWIYAVREGYQNMGSGSEHGEELPHLVIYVTAQKIARRPEQVNGFVKAMVKSMQYCRDHVPETLETIVRYSRPWGVDNLEIAKMVYDVFIPNWSASIDLPATTRLLRRASGDLKRPMPPVSGFVESRFLEAAMSE